MTPELIFSSSLSCSWVVDHGLRGISVSHLQHSICGQLSDNSLDGQGLGIANVGKVGDQLEAIDDLAACGTAALGAEAQDASETPCEVLLGGLVVWVAFQTRVGNPGNVGALLQVPGQGQSVLSVALGAEAESLGTDDELLGSKGVEGGTNVTQELYSGANDEGDGAKGLPELEAVVSL